MTSITASALLEKLQSENDYLKKAQLVDMLRREECLSVKEIAEKIKKHPSYVSHLNRLLKLPTIVIDGYYGNQISLSHLIILSRLNEKKEMETVYREILERNLTSNQTEELIRLKKFSIETQPDKVAPEELKSLINLVQHKFTDAQIKVVQTRIKGKIVLEMKGNSKQTTEFLRTILSSLASRQSFTFETSVDELIVLE